MPPSPTTQTHVRSGRATAAPVAAASPRPTEPKPSVNTNPVGSGTCSHAQG